MKTRVAYFGVFTALALILSYVETLIPIPIGIPGVKLGLANLIIDKLFTPIMRLYMLVNLQTESPVLFPHYCL